MQTHGKISTHLALPMEKLQPVIPRTQRPSRSFPPSPTIDPNLLPLIRMSTCYSPNSTGPSVTYTLPTPAGVGH